VGKGRACRLHVPRARAGRSRTRTASFTAADRAGASPFAFPVFCFSHPSPRSASPSAEGEVTVLSDLLRAQAKRPVTILRGRRFQRSRRRVTLHAGFQHHSPDCATKWCAGGAGLPAGSHHVGTTCRRLRSFSLEHEPATLWLRAIHCSNVRKTLKSWLNTSGLAFV
jgi:hypothetical protein